MASGRDIDISKAIPEALLGVVILGIFLTRLAPLLPLEKVDYVRLLGTYVLTAFGFPEGTHVIVIGWTLFCLWGVGWSLIYAFYVSDRLPGPGWLQGLIYAGGGVFLVSLLLFFPLLRWAHSMIHAGATRTPELFDLGLSSGQIVLASFLGHCLFGFILGLVYRRRLVF